MKKISFLVSLVMAACLIGQLPGCSSDDVAPAVDCSVSGLVLNLTSKSNPTSCTSPDGSIAVTGNGGTGPYQYKIDSGPFQDGSTFSNLAAGSFQISIKDANGCENTISVELSSPGNLAITSVVANGTTCGGSSGSISVSATGSTALNYRINSGAFGPASTFNNLTPGNYTITVADANSCTISTTARVLSGVSYVNDVRPILQSSCGLNNSGCHSSSAGSDLNNYNSVRLRAGQIKTRISLPEGNPSLMPKGRSRLPQSEIDRITCWVDDGAPNN